MVRTRGHSGKYIGGIIYREREQLSNVSRIPHKSSNLSFMNFECVWGKHKGHYSLHLTYLGLGYQKGKHSMEQ